MGNLENVSSRSIEETHKDRVTQKEGGGVKGPKRGVRVVKREGQGREKERSHKGGTGFVGREKKRENERGEKGGQGPREGFFIHVFE